MDRFFSREDSMYRIRKEIRELLVFAPHNVCKDPPFTKLDMISCRNLLIYLDGDAQRRLLPIFHYALRPGGVLFLGPSETICGFGDLFETIDGKSKIYRRKESLTVPTVISDMRIAVGKMAVEEPTPTRLMAGVRQSHTTAVIERLLLSRFAPTALVVNDRGAIIYIHGRTGNYLEPTQGQPNNNVLEMARQGLAHPLMSAFRQASAQKREIVRTNLRVKTNGDFTGINLSVTPLAEPEAVSGLYLITLIPALPVDVEVVAKPDKHKKDQPGRIEELERELGYTKESLQTTIEELETSNEELRSTNEELQSTNEELQSANEELETSKEEMQSLNEELSTVNTELQAKVEDLAQTTSDMQNLLNNTDVATIFLDRELRVKRYTEPARRLVNLIPSDVGRPLSDLSSNIVYGTLIDDCRQVLDTLERKEVEIRTREGSCHLMRAMPYRTTENMIDGVVITFLDIDRPKREAVAVIGFFESIVQTIDDPLVVIDSELKAEFANETFCRLMNSDRKAIINRPFQELGWDNHHLPELHRKLERFMSDGADLGETIVQRTTSGDNVKRFHVDARRINRESEEPASLLLVLKEAHGSRKLSIR